MLRFLEQFFSIMYEIQLKTYSRVLGPISNDSVLEKT